MSKPTTTKDGKAELVPTVPKKLQGDLAAFEQKLSDAGSRVAKRSESLAYAVIEYGYYLLKIRALYALSPAEAGKRKSLSQRETGSPNGEPVGFSGWLAAKEDEVPRGTAYRYMNAAVNAGLTENSNESALHKLVESRALKGKKLVDLYKSPRQLSAPKENEQLEFNLVAEVLTENQKLCKQLIDLRDDMDEDQLRAAVERLEQTLEELTGAEWEMVGTKSKSNKKEIRQHGH